MVWDVVAQRVVEEEGWGKVDGGKKSASPQVKLAAKTLGIRLLLTYFYWL